tara:strand:- start:1045 stop:1296 length:252 start_codon:yes stop_codon:yes gene_type:complete
VNIKELKEKFNLPISSGNGKSIDNPIVIEKKESKNYVKLEYFIISHLIEMDDNFDYERCNQKLLKYNDQTIDYLKINLDKSSK